MAKHLKLSSLVTTVLVISINSANTHAAEIYNKNGNKIDFYGKTVGEHSFTTSGTSTSSTDTSYARIGFKGETQINDQLIGFGQWEYNAPANHAESDNDQGQATRLAFAGVRLGDGGAIDYGRNYGAIYDVAAYTDMLVGWGGDSWAGTDNFMNGRANSVLTYRNNNFFGLVDDLSFALQYQGKNDRDNIIDATTNEDGTIKTPKFGGNGAKANGDGFSSSVQYAFGEGFSVAAGYEIADRTNNQVNPASVTYNGTTYSWHSAEGANAQAWAAAAKYDANNLYAAVMYAETLNMTREPDNNFANKTQNIEMVLQYQFDFGLRPSVGYVQSKGKDLRGRTAHGETFTGGDADLVKYIEVGSWYYFNKNMNIYAAYKFNLLHSDEYSRASNQAVDDKAVMGITYQF